MNRPSVRSRNAWTRWRLFSSVRLPTTMPTTKRCSGSKAAWSQQSPQRSSPGAQCFCFLTTKDPFSSNGTSRVVGGKSHEFLVAPPGVGTGAPGVADDRVFIDADETSGLSDAAPLLQVLQDGEGAVVSQACAEQGRAFALGEASSAGATREHAPSVLAIAEADTEITAAAHAVVGAIRVLTAEEVEVFHERRPYTSQAD